MYLVTADEMREMDRKTIDEFGLPGRVLMENAGRGAFEFLMETFPGIGNLRVGVLAGRGNNGGDGYVIARYLAHRNIDVGIYLLADRSRVSGDAAANLELLGPLGIPVMEIPDHEHFDPFRRTMRAKDLWIDAILGTGLTSEVRGIFRDVIDFVNSLEKPVFAVDVPSGLNSDTGQTCGSCIRATATATFGFAKTGHFSYPGALLSGKLKIVDIGIPPQIAEDVHPKQFLLTRKMVKGYLRPRTPDAHKGRTGHLLVVAGSTGKTGAAVMTAKAAVRCGAGLVTLGSPESLNPAVESQVVEVMTEPLPESESGRLGESAWKSIRDLSENKRCLALGPGIGGAPSTKKLVHRLVAETPLPLVIDADGLNNLADAVDLLRKRGAPTILTPHPGEMARLAGVSVKAVQSDRIASSREFALAYKVHVVLKGANTVIAHPDGYVFINPTGNAGMASGGMGDVLTGAIAGFLAQGHSPETASHLGVYLHGASADSLAAAKGPWGYLATEVMDGIPQEIRRLLP